MKRTLLLLLLCLTCNAQSLFDPAFVARISPVAASGVTLPHYVSAAATDFSATNSPTTTLPSNSENDILLAVFTTSDGHTTSGTPPEGWVKLDELDDAGADTSTSTFWKRAGPSEVSPVEWTGIFGSAESGVAHILSYRGCVASGSPISTSTNAIVASQTAVDLSIEVTEPSLCVAIVGIDPGFTTRTLTWDGGITPRIYLGGTPNAMDGSGTALAANYVAEKASATSGNVAFSGDFETAEAHLIFIYSLKP